jgi:hypothetical protein
MALVFVMSPFVFAGDKNNGNEMSGTICDQKCVKQDVNKASCDTSCTEQSGEAAFIDDQGKAWKVANPAICKGHMGKRAKVKSQKNDDAGTLWINSLSLHG